MGSVNLPTITCPICGYDYVQFHKGCVYLAHQVLPEAEVPHEDIWRY